MIDIDDFMPLVQINAPAAPEPLVRLSIRQAAITFCERTRMWKDHDIIETDGVDPEPITVPNDSVLFEVAACSQGCSEHERGKRLDPITIKRLAEEHPNWRHGPIGDWGGSRWFVCPEMGNILAVPRCRGVLTVETIVRPAVYADTLPDFLLEQYGVDIANGASALVLAKPEIAFSNPALAGALAMLFSQRLGALSNMGSTGQQKARARVRAQMM